MGIQFIITGILMFFAIIVAYSCFGLLNLQRHLLFIQMITIPTIVLSIGVFISGLMVFFNMNHKTNAMRYFKYTTYISIAIVSIFVMLVVGSTISIWVSAFFSKNARP